MRPSPNGRIALGLGGVVAVMVALSFAAVPFYDWFCRVTGYAGTTSVAEAPAGKILDRKVTVRFDANTAPDMPWVFRPMQRTMEIRLGETGLALYEAYNPTDRTIGGRASYNVAPYSVGGYFDKIACFCFNEQVLGPGERVEMPESFYVDPAMLDDREARDVTGITLSYTMHRAELPEPEEAPAAQAALATGGDGTTKQ